MQDLHKPYMPFSLHHLPPSLTLLMSRVVCMDLCNYLQGQYMYIHLRMLCMEF